MFVVDLVSPPSVFKSNLSKRKIFRYQCSYCIPSFHSCLLYPSAPPWDFRSIPLWIYKMHTLSIHIPSEYSSSLHSLPSSCNDSSVVQSSSSSSTDNYLTESFYFSEDHLTKSYTNDLINDYDLQSFTLSFNPLDYFSLFNYFSFYSMCDSDSPPDTFSSVSVLVNELLCLQGQTSGTIFCFSSSDNDPFIVLDPGASYSVTPLALDFLEKTFVPQPSTVDQLSSADVISGFDQDYWRFTASDNNTPVDLLPTNTYLIPLAHIRLFSPQVYLNQMNQGEVVLNPQGYLLHLPGGRSYLTPYNTTNNIPLLHSLPISDTPPCVSALPLFSSNSLSPSIISTSVADESNQNLSPSQKELLIWYWRLGHAYFKLIQSLMKLRTFLDNNNNERDEDPIIT